MIRFACWESHYFLHLAPIAALVDAELWTSFLHPIPDDGMPTVIAGWSDLARVPHSCPVALVSHGVDQTYAGVDHGSYAGGRNRERISLFVCSTPRGLEANRERWPDARHVLAGPTRLDGWWDWAHDGDRPRPKHTPRTVGFAWHFDLTITQETRSAFSYYLPVLERLAASGEFTLLGHAHPRAWGQVGGHYDRLGIERVENSGELFTRSDLICVDNSSLIYEAAAVGIPVLALDAPFYRDQPRQPPRFYADVPGLRLRAYRDQAPDVGKVHPEWGRDHLAAAISEALADRAELQTLREDVTARVYGDAWDGHAAERAADAIQGWAG